MDIKVKIKIMEEILGYIAGVHPEDLTYERALDCREQAKIGLWLARELSKKEKPAELEEPSYPMFVGDKLKFTPKNLSSHPFEHFRGSFSDKLSDRYRQTALALRELFLTAERIQIVLEEAAGREGPEGRKDCGHFATERMPGCWTCGTSSERGLFRDALSKAKKVLDRFGWVC